MDATMAGESPREVDDLRRRLEEAEETLRAIRSGEVDALVVTGPEGERIYTLQGADHAYRALIETMQQGAVSLNEQGTVLFCNRRFAEMLKQPHERVIGANVAKFIPGDLRSAFDDMRREGMSRFSQGEGRLLAEDESELPVYLAMAPLPEAAAASLSMVVTDLTEQKQHQNLQKVNRRKDEFLAMLAHELRNPLAPIRNAVALLHLLDAPEEKLIYARDIIERQSQFLSRLVDDLLDVSRITLGKVKLQKERVDLGAVVARAVEIGRPYMDARNHRFTVAIPREPMWAMVDPTRLTQVIGNLLNNAAKYTEENGEIHLSVQREKELIIIRVRDTGLGINLELLPHIFDLFTQGDRSLARSDGGLGVGLTLVRSLVELHGGSVDARSEGLGKGSEFVVRLPASRAESIAATTKKPENDRNGHLSLRVFVVDDNKDGAESLAMLLRFAGHQVQVAYNGLEALETAKTFHPHVFVLDIGLPGLNGFEVAKQLRQQPRFAESLMIAVTGYGQEDDKRQSKKAGFDHHLVKPVNVAALQALVAGFGLGKK